MTPQSVAEVGVDPPNPIDKVLYPLHTEPMRSRLEAQKLSRVQPNWSAYY